MRIISFAWTTYALVSGNKTQTRRFWKDSYAETFKEGEQLQAYDKNPRAGGKLIALIRLIKKPYKQKLLAMSHEDFLAEGGYYYWKGRLDFIDAMESQGKGDEPWVLEFEVLKVVKHDCVD